MTALRSSLAALIVASFSLTGAAVIGTAFAQEKISADAAGDADPLTPKAIDLAPPVAPGAPAVISPQAMAVAAQQNPAAAIVVSRLSEAGKGGKASTEDREALAAYYQQNGGQLLWASAQGPNAKANAALEELGRAADYGLSGRDAYVVTIPASFAAPEAQADFELSLDQALMTYARHARGGRTDPGHISQMIDMRPRPFEAKSVIAALAAADDPAAALRRFHPQHEGFKRLQKALQAARESGKAGAEAIQRLEVNLERWRWMPDDLGAFHIENNLPEQLTRVYDDGKVALTEKIVIGKPSSPTPIMSADMQFVIFHPSWGVPSGIKSNEVGPLLKRAAMRNQEFFGGGDNASKALARHQLRVSMNGHEINPDSVDWNSVDVRRFDFTQPPGSQNVLGVVKFRFPNRHDVYMHDTTERNLFSVNVRAFSHGCMRVQNPIHLAEVILGHDKGWSAEKVRGFVPGGRSADISLTTQVPVHLTYFTATADDTGAVHTFGDIYGMDSRVASALAGRQVALASADVRDVPSTPAARKRVAAVAMGKKPVAKAWSPFDW